MIVYQLLADTVLVLHFCFIAFVLGGGFLAWRWPRAAWLHVPALTWGVLVEARHWICPLTPLENHFRRLAGDGVYSGDFIERYCVSLIYPKALTPQVQLWLGVSVLALNVAVYSALLRARRRRRPIEDGQT